MPFAFAAMDAFERETETLGDRAAPSVLDAGADHHPVHAELPEREVDQGGARPRHQALPFVVPGDPVPELRPDPERAGHESDPADAPSLDRQRRSLETLLIGEDRPEPRALIVHGPRQRRPRHPRVQVVSVRVDEREQLVGVVERVPTELRPSPRSIGSGLTTRCRPPTSLASRALPPAAHGGGPCRSSSPGGSRGTRPRAAPGSR